MQIKGFGGQETQQPKIHAITWVIKGVECQAAVTNIDIMDFMYVVFSMVHDVSPRDKTTSARHQKRYGFFEGFAQKLYFQP